MTELKNKTALVTGSSSGIGLAIAKSFAAVGVNIVTNSSTDSEKVRAQASDLATEYGVEFHYVPADVSIPKECTRLVNDAASTFGGIDILVNNAGVQHVAPVEDFPVTEWDRIIAINLSAVFHTTRAALPLMRKAGWGRIINIGSAHSLTASPNKAAYVAAKHGVAGLTKTVALETAEDGITANVICPAWVLTSLVEAQIPDQMKIHGLDRESVIRDVMLARQPTKKFIPPDQIGGVAVFLCSDAAAQITGATLTVDGGWTAL